MENRNRPIDRTMYGLSNAPSIVEIGGAEGPQDSVSGPIFANVACIGCVAPPINITSREQPKCRGTAKTLSITWGVGPRRPPPSYVAPRRVLQRAHANETSSKEQAEENGTQNDLV